MRRLFAWVALLLAWPAGAETLNLDQAIARALTTDPRIEEREYLVNAAEGLLQEVEGRGDWFVESNAFLGLSPAAEGNIFKDGACTPGQCELRDDKYEFTGLSPWFHLKMGVIKPLYTFGKLEHYSDAARANIDIKDGDVRLQRGATVLEVKKAYYGYLAARDGRLLLEDVNKKLQGIIDMVENWLEEGEGEVSLADLYALQSGQGLLGKFHAQSIALEKVALDGLKVLTGVGLGNELSVADRRLKPLPVPDISLSDLKQRALQQRAEMEQLEAGMKARRHLVEASKAENMPNIYTGMGALLSYSPLRERQDNPYLSDPFNEGALTPMVGIQWSWSKGVISGKTASAQAELDALIAKSSFARMGIPFQVAEQYHQVQGHYDAVQKLEQASRSARSWVVASYQEFEAGLEKSDRIILAFQTYVMARTDYLQTTFQYNMHVARLEDVAGMIQ